MSYNPPMAAGEDLGTIPAEFADVLASGRTIRGPVFYRKTAAQERAEAAELGRAMFKTRRLARLENRWRAKANRLASEFPTEKEQCFFPET